MTTHTIKSEIKGNISIGIPLITAQSIYACSGFIGTVMVARLGKEALAASILVSMVWISLSVFFFGVLNAVSILISHQYGAKNFRAISEIMTQSFLLGVVICIANILILSTMPFFLHLSSQPPVVLALAKNYMWAMMWTIPGLIALIIGEQFLAGLGRSKLVLQISMLIVPIEIVLIYLLIFGKMGLPQCGIAGVGYGFAVTYTASGIFLIYHLLYSKKYRQFEVFKLRVKNEKNYFFELIRVGLPLGFMHLIEISTFGIATFFIAQFGTTLLAAHQIVMQYVIFASTAIFAMSQAVAVRVGHAVGRIDKLGVHFAVYSGTIFSFFIIIFVVLSFIFAPTYLLHLDIDVTDVTNRDLVNDSSNLLIIGGVMMLFDNFRIVAFGALRALKDTRFCMYTSLVCFWIVGLFSAYYFGIHLNFKGDGIWWGLTLGIILGSIILWTRIFFMLRKMDKKSLHFIGVVR